MIREADLVTAGALVSRLPVYVRPTATLREAAEILDGNAVGALLVRGHDALAGIVSERDVVRALAEGCDPDLERVEDVMTDDVAGVEQGVTVAGVASRMIANEIRHLVVYDDDDVLGVISIRDVLATLW